MSAEDFFNSARAYKRELTGNQGAVLTQEDVDILNAATVTRWKPPEAASNWSREDPISLSVALEIIGHEAIVQEAYKDSVGVWTWSVGITNNSGHTVYPRYKDNPQPLLKCLEIFLWVLKEKYVPAVLEAFNNYPNLTEYQFAAALSFHYNTGAIGRADWVELFLSGHDSSRERIMDWKKPASIIPRREKEQELFFDGKWSNDGKVTIYPVRKPSYQPDFRNAQRVDIRSVLQGMLA